MWKQRWPALWCQIYEIAEVSCLPHLCSPLSRAAVTVSVDAWVPEISSCDTASKIKTIRSYFSFIHIHGNKLYHAYTVCEGLQCWFFFLLTELWSCFLTGIFCCVLLPSLLEQWDRKKLIEGTSQEARKRQGILKKKKWKCRTILFLLSFQKIQVNAAEIAQK